MRSLRIFLACSDDRLRLALLMLLDQQPGMVVAGMADRFTGLVSQLEGAQPEVLILDWDQPGETMGELFQDIQNLESHPMIIVLSGNPELRGAALAAGAIFFICRDAPPDMLIPVLNDLRLSKINKQING
jgi:DNA-binding NarL/FixJ family response regulator